MTSNLSNLIAATEGHGAWWAPVFWVAVVFLVIAVLLRVAVTGARQNVPKSYISRLAEHGYLFIENMCVGVIGPHGRKYIPLVLTIYLVILFSNMFGGLGGGGGGGLSFFPAAPTMHGGGTVGILFKLAK